MKYIGIALTAVLMSGWVTGVPYYVAADRQTEQTASTPDSNGSAPPSLSTQSEIASQAPLNVTDTVLGAEPALQQHAQQIASGDIPLMTTKKLSNKITFGNSSTRVE